ncbi:MAG: hypothetical protein U0792_08215 [Gemmataceae bacterium]
MHTMFAFLGISELQFRGSFIPWVAILLGVFGSVAVIVLYVKESAKLPLLPRLAMAGVRTGIVVLIAFLLMRPVWVAEEKRDKKRPVAVLIDVSQSMDNADPRPSSEDQARAAIAFGLIDADKGLPGEALSASHEKTLNARNESRWQRVTSPTRSSISSNASRKVGPLGGVHRSGCNGSARIPRRTTGSKERKPPSSRPHSWSPRSSCSTGMMAMPPPQS